MATPTKDDLVGGHWMIGTHQVDHVGSTATTKDDVAGATDSTDPRNPDLWRRLPAAATAIPAGTQWETGHYCGPCAQISHLDHLAVRDFFFQRQTMDIMDNHGLKQCHKAAMTGNGKHTTN